MSEIAIYKNESSVPGLAEKISQARVIAYTMPLIPWKPEDAVKYPTLAKELFPEWVTAGANDSDLYYTKSIYVTTNWNKNADVFDKVEAWVARATPTHKPTNIEHDEKQLVGHITDCFAMTLEGQLIPDNINVDDLPEVYHLVNGAVIYRGWRDSDLRSRANKLIEEIEEGKKYVSMECAFTNFSYAVINPEGKCSVIARDKDSSWITKHLRAYGGTGEHNGYRFGRLLRNITFSGKGYVDKPANPDSIIFSDAAIFNFTNASQENVFIENNGVYLNREDSNKENITMSNEIDILKTQLEEVKTQLTSALQAKASVEEKLAKADVAKFETRIVELEGQLTSSKAEIETSKKSLAEITAKCDEDEKKMKEEKKAKADLEQKLAEMVQAQITASRITSLVEGGIERETATKKVALYANLNDEQFKDISVDLIAAVKKDEKKEEKAKKDESCASESATSSENETNADESVLENAKPDEQAPLAAGGEQVDETTETRKLLQETVASFINNKVNPKDSE